MYSGYPNGQSTVLLETRQNGKGTWDVPSSPRFRYWNAAVPCSRSAASSRFPGFAGRGRFMLIHSTQPHTMAPQLSFVEEWDCFVDAQFVPKHLDRFFQFFQLQLAIALLAQQLVSLSL